MKNPKINEFVKISPMKEFVVFNSFMTEAAII